MTIARRPVSVEYRKAGPPVYRDATGRALSGDEVAVYAAARLGLKTKDAAATSEDAHVAIVTSDALRHLAVAWHGKFSTEELRWIAGLRERLEAIAEDETGVPA